MRILMTAAHGGFGSEKVPLGGGAAIFERLVQAWLSHPEVELTVAGGGPGLQGGGRYVRLGHTHRIPSQLSALEYARFSREFERESTRLALEVKPDLVLAHDVSEGPNLRRLRASGIDCATVFHVDVVEIFRRLYLKGWGSTEGLAALYRRTETLPWPDLLKLVFAKQEQVLRDAVLNIVPSSEAASLLASSYPKRRGDILVLGWGVPELPYSAEEVSERAVELRRQHSICDDTVLILTLSRLSPEKAQDRLLRAVESAERRGSLPRKLGLVIAGAPAFMKGHAHERHLRRTAQRLSTPVHFPGHVGGLDRAGWYRAADLFVVNSLHESYGLTTLEAQQQGCATVAVESSGTKDTVDSRVGRLVPPGPLLEQRLWGEIELLLRDENLKELRDLGKAALARARESKFEAAADRLLTHLKAAQAKHRAS